MSNCQYVFIFILAPWPDPDVSNILEYYGLDISSMAGVKGHI